MSVYFRFWGMIQGLFKAETGSAVEYGFHHRSRALWRRAFRHFHFELVS